MIGSIDEEKRIWRRFGHPCKRDGLAEGDPIGAIFAKLPVLVRTQKSIVPQDAYFEGQYSFVILIQRDLCFSRIFTPLYCHTLYKCNEVLEVISNHLVMSKTAWSGYASLLCHSWKSHDGEIRVLSCTANKDNDWWIEQILG